MNYNDYLNLSEEDKQKFNLSDISDEDKFKFDCLSTRQSGYPSTDEWMRALIQKELDGQPEEWNKLVCKRNQIKAKYPKL